MNKFEFAALAVGLLLQSLTFADIAPSKDPVFDYVASNSLTGRRHVADRAVERQDYFLIPDVNDLRGEECDPEDDCPRPPTSK
jgi:hypothetical protein